MMPHCFPSPNWNPCPLLQSAKARHPLICVYGWGRSVFEGNPYNRTSANEGNDGGCQNGNLTPPLLYLNPWQFLTQHRWHEWCVLLGKAKLFEQFLHPPHVQYQAQIVWPGFSYTPAHKPARMISFQISQLPSLVKHLAENSSVFGQHIHQYPS